MRDIVDYCLIVSGFVIGAILFMAISLHFSRYKKRTSGCCGYGPEESAGGISRSESC